MRLISLLVATTLVLFTLTAFQLDDAQARLYPPTPPTNLSATPGVGSVTITWWEPYPGSTPLSDFVVFYRVHDSDDSIYSTPWTRFDDGIDTTLAVTVTGLVDGTYYDFKIASVNSIGHSSWGRISATPGIPSAPTNFIAVAGNAQVMLSWDTPSDNGGSVISDYVIQYRIKGTDGFTTFKDGKNANTTATVTDLSNGVSYDFRVVARNQVTTGIWSDVISVKTPVPPSAPMNVKATPGFGSVKLSWDVPQNDGGSEITDYKIQYRIGITWITYNDLQNSDSSVTLTLAPLPCIKYDLRVAAINVTGQGPWSSIESTTTQSLSGNC